MVDKNKNKNQTSNEYLNSLIKPYPYLAFKKAFKLMVVEAVKMFGLCEGDKFKIGYNLHNPSEIIYLIDKNWTPTIRLDEDDDKMKYFWEMHYNVNPNGCHLTLRKQDSFFTVFYGYCYAKNEALEFIPVFMLEEKGD